MAKASFGSTVPTTKPKADVWLALVILTFVAMLAAVVILWLENSTLG